MSGMRLERLNPRWVAKCPILSGMPRPPAWGGAKASCDCQFSTNEPVTVCSISSTTICAALARLKVA
eukprot:541930-Amphidinium_carterae.2